MQVKPPEPSERLHSQAQIYESGSCSDTLLVTLQAVQQARGRESHTTNYSGGRGQQGSGAHAERCWQTYGSCISLRQGVPAFPALLATFGVLPEFCQRTPEEVLPNVVTSGPDLPCRCLGLNPVRKGCTLALLLP